jgi:hypothetical protein
MITCDLFLLPATIVGWLTLWFSQIFLAMDYRTLVRKIPNVSSTTLV